MNFKNVKECIKYLSITEEIIFDGTENLTERSQNNEKQRDKFSGKKKTHTDIAMVLSDKATRIYCVSEYYDGKHSDMGVLKNES